ncbi:MAG TPA: FKBP-type peptidyl-prolyl cis-trans isomerase [Pyrinomonadaceae bacterium]|nr:FKBP-type peptidyl-prolyl cis-trans isomerase [Pyrinomonadaceae bacterium]
MKKTIVLALLILNVFAADALSQTRKRTTGSTRGKRTTATRTANTKPKTMTKPNTITPAATTTASGLTYIITQKNEAGQQLKTGDNVQVHYTGLLTNGVKFDSSLDRGEPISFPLGTGRVIKGWDEGILKLRVGERATLIIPPSIGYGSKGAGGGVIPPDATLIVIVEVVGVK